MHPESRLKLTPQFVIGVCLILLGSLLTLDRLQIAGYVMIGMGTLLLLNSFGLIRVRFWELFWPAMIVLVGARLLMQTSGRSSERHRTGSTHVSGQRALAAPSMTSGTFEVHAVDYLLKHFSAERLAGALVRARARIGSKDPRRSQIWPPPRGRTEYR